MDAAGSLTVAVARKDWEIIETYRLLTPVRCAEQDAAGKYPLEVVLSKSAPAELVDRLQAAFSAADVADARALWTGVAANDWDALPISPLTCTSTDAAGNRPAEAACQAKAPLDTLLAMIRAAPAAPRSLFLSHRGLDDAAVAGFIEALTGGSGPSVLWSLDLSHNNITQLPLALTGLQSLTEVNLSGNPRLVAAEKITQEKGVPGLFDYLRDLNDDPQPQYKIKLLLAGPSLAGKSSALRRLLNRTDVLTDVDTERTIGLDIQRLWLPDPFGRAPEGIELVCYDAGGHDEYQVRRLYCRMFRLFLR